ncbi:MAG: oligosaccharide flippase family protein [Candidatus Paceibacterota bacterium]
MKKKILEILKWSEKYTKTDMTYIAKGGFWLILNKVGILLASFITMVAFGNWLSQEAFGVYQYIIAGTSMVAILTLPGINTSIIKSIAQGKEGTLWVATKERFRWSILGSLGLLIASGWYFINGNALLGGGLLMAGILMPGEKIFTIFKPYWNGKKDFKNYTKYSLGFSFFFLLILIPAIYLTNNVLIIIFAYFISSIIFAGLFFLKTLKQVKNYEVDETAIPFGKSLTMMGTFQTIARHIDKIIVWKFLGPVQVAIYSFSILPINKIIGIIPVGPLALPKLGEKKIDRKRKKGVMAKFLKLFLVFIPMAVVLALIAPFIYGIFFPQYMESVKFFQVLTLLVAVGGPFVILDSALIVEVKTKYLYIIKTTVPAVKIGLFLALIPFYGIWGMVWAMIISEIIRGIFLVYYFKKL